VAVSAMAPHPALGGDRQVAPRKKVVVPRAQYQNTFVLLSLPDLFERGQISAVMDHVSSCVFGRFNTTSVNAGLCGVKSTTARFFWASQAGLENRS